ncbi:MAG: DUF1800 domain-containing protein [Thiotrichaceae bacterium]|nr:DUF1800 domain-containing protein [Thiotrichaceae bacterium]
MVDKLDLADASHLVTRAGIGAEWATIKKLQGMTRHQAINKLINAAMMKPKTPSKKMTPWAVRMNMYKAGNPAFKMKMFKMTRVQNDDLKIWWLSHMLETSSPLIEKLTLFWHGHFVSSLTKVEQPKLIYKQHLLLRQHAMGSYASMLKAVVRDPAMSVYLDGRNNKKDSPNENFARELLELFTVGHGHYNEFDIKNVAKAFTGASVNRFREQYAFNANEHDFSVKKVFGKNVKTGDDVVRVLLAQSRTSLTIAEKFWNLFISDSKPDPRYTQRWAHQFKRSNYNIKILLSAVLNSDAFWSPRYRGQLTKSPVDLVVGSLRTIPSKLFNKAELVGILRLLDQDLFDPPNVKGWRVGHSWIDAETIMVRSSMVNKLTRGSMNARVNRGDQFPNLTPSEFQAWLLPNKAIKALPETPGKVRLVRALVLDPMYQLM